MIYIAAAGRRRIFKRLTCEDCERREDYKDALLMSRRSPCLRFYTSQQEWRTYRPDPESVLDDAISVPFCRKRPHEIECLLLAETRSPDRPQSKLKRTRAE